MQIICSKARTAGVANIFIALGDLSEIGRYAAVRREDVDLKDQAAAPRIIVHHVREWRVGEQSSVPILFAIDLDRRKAGRYCPTRHNMLGTNCNFLAIEIVEVAGPYVDRADA